MMILDNKFEIGQIVYLITDQEQLPRIVIALMVYAKGEIQYLLMSGNDRSDHYAFEISDSVNEELKAKNL